MDARKGQATNYQAKPMQMFFDKCCIFLGGVNEGLSSRPENTIILIIGISRRWTPNLKDLDSFESNFYFSFHLIIHYWGSNPSYPFTVWAVMGSLYS